MLSFNAAMTPAEVTLKGYSPLPPDWEAGIPNHGEISRWILPAKHPFLYFGSWVILLSSIFFWILGLLRIREEMDIIRTENFLHNLYKKR